MICPKCKSNIPDDSEFCQYCGANIKVEENLMHNTEKANSDNTVRQKKTGKMLSIVFAVIMVVAIAAAIIFGVFLQKDEAKIEELNNTIAANSEIEKEYEALQKDYDEVLDNYETAQENYETVQKNYDDLNSKYNTLKNSSDNLSEFSKYYAEDLADALGYGNLGYASENFRSSESVIFLKKNNFNSNFYLTAYWENGGSVNYTYYPDEGLPSAYISCDNDEWDVGTTMSITPLRTGVTRVNFSNNVDGGTFNIIIVVTE